jgi:hypothetical protein
MDRLLLGEFCYHRSSEVLLNETIFNRENSNPIYKTLLNKHCYIILAGLNDGLPQK